MNIRDLEYIDAVARLGGFGKAAEACHVSQPTLSGQIKKLEDYLGVTLFERTTKRVMLTEAGRRVVALARQALGVVREIEDTAAGLRDEVTGTLRLGLIPTIAPYLVPRFIGRLKSTYPTLKPIVQEDITERLLAQLQAGSLDAAILATEPEGPMDDLPLYDEPFLLALPRGHGLAAKAQVTAAEIDPAELLLLTEGHCFRDQALDLCQLPGGGDGTDLAATSLATLLQLVDMGQGITLVPALALDQTAALPAQVVTKPLNDATARRTVRLVSRKGFPRRKLLAAVAKVIAASVPQAMRRMSS